MATWDDVRRCALALPETQEGASYGLPAWRVRGRLFAWERPLGRKDLEALGTTAPDGPVLATSVPDVAAKEALVAAEAEVFFTTPHFDGYAAVLVRLDRIPLDELEELLGEAWAVRAPKRLVQQHLAPGGGRAGG